MFYLSDVMPKAKALIEETLKDIESASDRAYATGLIDMAFELKTITLKQKTQYLAYLYSMELKK